jgi:hypothetical protein
MTELTSLLATTSAVTDSIVVLPGVIGGCCALLCEKPSRQLLAPRDTPGYLVGWSQRQAWEKRAASERLFEKAGFISRRGAKNAKRQ